MAALPLLLGSFCWRTTHLGAVGRHHITGKKMELFNQVIELEDGAQVTVRATKTDCGRGVVTCHDRVVAGQRGSLT